MEPRPGPNGNTDRGQRSRCVNRFRVACAGNVQKKKEGPATVAGSLLVGKSWCQVLRRLSATGRHVPPPFGASSLFARGMRGDNELARDSQKNVQVPGGRPMGRVTVEILVA